MAKASWWQFWKPQRTPSMGARNRLPSGRVTRDKDHDLAPGMMALAPPASLDGSWHLLAIDRALLERLSPARLLEVLADMSPEVSRAYWDFLRLCNPGWEATAHAVTSAGEGDIHKPAQAALDTFLDALDDHYGAADVVFGQLFTGAFLRGALFAELVMDDAGRLPVDLVTPDPISVRFRRVFDAARGGPVWQAGQWQRGEFVPFDRPTVRYTPVDPYPGSPYGRPLAAPALFVALFLLGMLHDIRRVVQQQGYPRLDLSIDTEKMSGMLDMAQTAEEQTAILKELVEQVETEFSRLEPDDTYIHTDHVTVNRPVGAVDASSLGAVDSLIAALERMATRALKSMPIMMGLVESNTETQANRQWEIYAAGVKSIQHYAETLLERLLTLALEAQGLQARVSFRFAELRAAEMLRDAQVETMQISNAKAKYDYGWVSQDEASEAITGHPADVPEPRVTSGGGLVFQQDDGDGLERTQRKPRLGDERVKIIPDGADEPLAPLPDDVEVSEADIERALDEWDELMPDYAGLLDADVVGRQDFDEPDRTPRVSTRQRDPSPWQYDQRLHRYRNTATGQFVGQRQMIRLRDAFTDAKREMTGTLTGRLGDGSINLQRWELDMRQHIKSAHIDQYVLGKGGRNNMTPRDWGRLGREMRDQYEHLRGFARDIADGKLSEAQIAARSRLYINSSTASFERGRQASYGIPDLPTYPAAGDTRCLSNCRCAWSIEETDDFWNCTWAIDPAAENCEDCQANAERWAPLVIAKAGRSREQVEAELAELVNGHR